MRRWILPSAVVVGCCILTLSVAGAAPTASPSLGPTPPALPGDAGAPDTVTEMTVVTKQLEAAVEKLKALSLRATGVKAQREQMQAERARASDPRSLDEQIQSISVFLLEVQRDLAREARQAQQTKKQLAQLAAKANKLKLANKQLDEQRREARERADNAMNAAQTQLASGIVGGALQVAAPPSVVRVSDAGTSK